MGKSWSQSVWIPSPQITEKNVDSQGGKVFVITGANSGVGFELAKILYAANAKIYLAGRSEKRVLEAIRLIRDETPLSQGDLVWLPLDLSDLASVKMAAEEFLSKEERLDVLWNNAGVMCTPTTDKSEQVNPPDSGYDLQLGTNVLGPYLLTKLLYPIMEKTARISPLNSVRICWASSITIELAPHGGVKIDDSGSPVFTNDRLTNYCASKAANNLLASEFGKKCRRGNVLSIAFNPGNLNTGLTRYMTMPILGSIVPRLMSLVMWPARYGAYTELYAGLSPDLTIEKHVGAFIWPWGHVGYLRPDIEDSLRSQEEGGSGKATQLLTWCDREVKNFT
ncbi:NAD(P)-binding protein [Penicillium brevicompactum]|uniref:NAD(P)-binding protein n=1 Tax=Penicillium brevicompactum TaxID=5074 RepID=A0A9W9UC28_PENBR|nr:NAD(P)-binding protein [Penicillium brevicompactum]